MSDEGGGSFEERLRAARERRSHSPATDHRSGPGGPDGIGGGRSGATAPGTATGPASALGIGLRVGAELVSALAVAVAIGWALDRWLHTMPVFIGLFVLLGGAAGVLNVWRVMQPRDR